jgi:ribonuclease P protein component
MQRLRRRADFLRAAKGKRAFAAAFVLQEHRRDDDGSPRVGFTVTRKVGSAVERNRMRRRLREALKRADAGKLRRGHDYVVVARRDVLTRRFDDLIADFTGTLRRLASAKAATGPDGRSKTSYVRPGHARAAGDESGQ